MRRCPRIFSAVCAVSLVLALAACNPAGTGQSPVNSGVPASPSQSPAGTSIPSNPGNPESSGPAVPPSLPCPDGLLAALNATVEATSIKQIPAAEYKGPDGDTGLAVGRTPSCAFELTAGLTGEIFHYAYFLGAGTDFVAYLGEQLVASGFGPGVTNTVDGGYWTSADSGLEVDHFGPGTYLQYPGVDFAVEFVLIF